MSRHDFEITGHINGSSERWVVSVIAYDIQHAVEKAIDQISKQRHIQIRSSIMVDTIVRRGNEHNRVA